MGLTIEITKEMIFEAIEDRRKSIIKESKRKSKRVYFLHQWVNWTHLWKTNQKGFISSVQIRCIWWTEKSKDCDSCSIKKECESFNDMVKGGSNYGTQ